MDNSQNTLDKVIAWFFIVVILLILAYGTYDTITHLTVWRFILLFEITNGESGDLRKIDESAMLLDIKHIVLEKDRETWLLSKNIFLNGNVFLLTPASMRWLSDWKHQQMMSDSSGRAMCAAVGERYRSSRYSEVVELVTKIQKAYNKQHDK